MKNIKYLWMICAIVLLLGGCGKGQQDNLAQRQTSPTPKKTEEAAPEEPSPEVTPTPTPEPVVISHYSTKLVDKRQSRLNNIARASDKISGTVVNPGETLSFNDVVGPRTKEAGYEKAIIYVEDEKVMGYGGGICQLSTTIYDAALDANLQIVERHEHQQEVQYAQKGMDAMVDYGTADLKIRNNKSFPIEIRTNLTENSVDVSILCIK